PRVPHLLHDGPWQRARQRVLGPARHDALRPPRGVGGQPRGLARGPSGRLAGRWAWRADLLVLALGRRRRRQLGPDQPARAAVDPPRRDPRGDPRPPGPPLTRVPSGWTWPRPRAGAPSLRTHRNRSTARLRGGQSARVRAAG